MRPVDPTASAVDAFIATIRALWSTLPGATWHDSTHLVRYDAPFPVPRFSGLCVLGADADEQLAADWLNDLVAREAPFCILSRPSAPRWVADLAARHHLDDVHHEPFMLHLAPASTAVPPGLTVTRVDPDDVEEVAIAQQLYADGFEAPVEILGAFMTPEVLRLAGMTALVGRDGGRPCTTGSGAVVDGHVGVFNIATPPEHRRRGYGHAVTAAVMADGVAAGAHTAYLQASPMGFPIYERMGFRTVEPWPCYYPAG